LDATQFLREAIRAGVTEDQREDFGEVAGETIMDLAVDPGMELPPTRPHLHTSVIHHAALSDVLTTALRKPGAPAWGLPPPAVVNGLPWASSAFLDPSGTKLRRVVLVTSWNDDRHYSDIQSWYGMGEVVAYGLPMQMAVLVLGSHRDGRRSGPWTKGFLHPQNHKLRFRKRAKVTSEVFSDKWEQVWREDRGEISTREWLGAMLEDDVLRDVCFSRHPAPFPDCLGENSGYRSSQVREVGWHDGAARGFDERLSALPVQGVLLVGAGVCAEREEWLRFDHPVGGNFGEGGKLGGIGYSRYRPSGVSC
jgi:hypothetical protein